MSEGGLRDHLSRVELEEAAVGELASERVPHLESCRACRRAVDALLEQSRDFVTAQPFAAFSTGRVEAALAPIESRAGFWSRRATLGAGFAAVAGAAAALWLVAPPAPEPALRIKGESFSAIRARGEAQTEHVGAVPVRPGDRLRFVLVLDRPAAVRLELTEGEELPSVQLFDGGRMSPGRYFIPETALRAEPPLVASRVRLYLDGELADEIRVRAEDDE